MLQILRRRRAGPQPGKAGGLSRTLFPTVLRLAFAEIIEDRSVIQNASVSVLDPVFDVGIFRRLLDTRHFSNDGDQRTGVYVLKEDLPVIVGKRGAGTHLPIGTVPKRDRPDSHRAPQVQSIHIHIGLDQMHEWVESVHALGAEKAIAGGERPRPSRPTRLQDLLGTPDVVPDIDQLFGPLRHILERRFRIFVALCLGQDHSVQGTDGYAGNLVEIARAVNDEVVGRACLECSFEATTTQHKGAFLSRVAVVKGLCRG